MSNYSKLKTNLKLSIQRLKLLEKKKTELSLKSRKEIADYLVINKPDRARIRVEHIIREDNYVEAMEMLEMFCDLLLARFGLIEKMKELDPGLDEAIATLIWCSPRVSSDIIEFKTIAEILSNKYGKKYAEACKVDTLNNVNEKVKKRLGLEAPSKLLVEQYLIEIAKNFNVNYVPDDSIMLSAGQTSEELIQLRDHVDDINKRYGGSGGGGGAASATFHIPTNETKTIPIGFNELEQNLPKNSGNSEEDDLIDLEFRDFNNNNNYENNKKSNINSNNNPGYPLFPTTLPTGDLPSSTVVSRNRPLTPPPSYLPSKKTEPSENNLENEYTKHMPPASFDSNERKLMPPDNENIANAPPLPSKHQINPNAFEEDFKTNDDEGMNEFSKSPPPSYKPPTAARTINNNLQNNGAAAKKNFPGLDDDDDDDLGLPAVPRNQPLDSDIRNPNNSVNADMNASIEYDDLAKRFQNLKSFNLK